MALFTMRDSWNVWRRKINEAIGGTVEPVKSEDVTYDNTDSGLTATNVQNAIDEVDSAVDSIGTTVGDATSGLVKDVADLKDKKFSYGLLWSGDASGGGNKELSESIEGYDALMLYYNNGSVSATIPKDFFKNYHGMKVQTYDNNTHYSATVGYVDATHIAVTASQSSTLYFIGIKYHS